MPSIRPISDLRNNANDISSLCYQTREPVYITKNGRYGIHVTDEPWSIGKSLSKGCIRMYNTDAKELKSYIPHITKVTIIKGIFDYWDDGFKTLKNGYCI